jgi:hypothetical protein
MEHLKLFGKRVNIPRLIRVCEEQEHWKELVYLYIQVGAGLYSCSTSPAEGCRVCVIVSSAAMPRPCPADTARSLVANFALPLCGAAAAARCLPDSL